VIIISTSDGLDLHDSQLTENCGNFNPNSGLIHGESLSELKETLWLEKKLVLYNKLKMNVMIWHLIGKLKVH
jgi:hypothetical protein